MQTITTKYLPATNCRGSRIKVTASGGISRTYAYDHMGDPHDEAVLSFCRALKWQGTLVHGETSTGRVYLFTNSPPILEV
jgi:hypothetical protein